MLDFPLELVNLLESLIQKVFVVALSLVHLRVVYVSFFRGELMVPNLPQTHIDFLGTQVLVLHSHFVELLIYENVEA